MEPAGLVLPLALLLRLAGAALEPLQHLQSTKHSARAFESLQAELSALYEILQRLQPLVVGNEAGESIIPENLLTACQETLQSIMKLIQKYVSSPRIAKAMTWILQQDEIERLKKDLDRQKSTFALILSSYAKYVSILCFAQIGNAKIPLLAAVCGYLRPTTIFEPYMINLNACKVSLQSRCRATNQSFESRLSKPAERRSLRGFHHMTLMPNIRIKGRKD